MSRATRPEGVITRGTTAPNRLRRMDRWIVHRLGSALRSSLVAGQSPLVVDLGFGDSPVTTIELARRLTERIGPGIRVVGLEIDPERVARARAACQGRGDTDVLVHVGGFELAVPGGQRPLVVRAANVLRQYPAGEVGAAWSLMSARLAPGGIIVEGTCDEVGRLSSWVAIPAQAAVPDSFTLSVDLNALDRPSRVAERLPKALIHHNVAGQPVHDLLQGLDRAWERAAALAVFGSRQRWVAAVRDLRGQGIPVRDDPRRWRLGELTVPWAVVAPATRAGSGA